MSLTGEVAESLAGMRGTLTALLRRIQILERREESRGGVVCVATREAINMPGMDSWCAENCRKGNCPPNLCACPVSDTL